MPRRLEIQSSSISLAPHFSVSILKLSAGPRLIYELHKYYPEESMFSATFGLYIIQYNAVAEFRLPEILRDQRDEAE